MNSKRQSQISNAIRKEFSELLSRDASHLFPANVLISITEVSISSDLSSSRIFFSIFNAEKPAELMEILNENKSELRLLLGRRLRNLRRIPELEFILDSSLEQAHKIDSIFKNIKKEDENSEE